MARREQRRICREEKREQNRAELDELLLTLEEIEEYDRLGQFKIPDFDICKDIYEEVRQQQGQSNMGELACLVCGLDLPVQVIETLPVEELPLQNMQLRLGYDANTPTYLKNYYDLGGITGVFYGLLLWRASVFDTDDELMVHICHTCLDSLCKHDEDNNPPRLALANGFETGYLPDHLYDSTWVEHAVCAPKNLIGFTRTIHPGMHNALIAHVVVIDASPGPVAISLPRPLQEGGVSGIIFSDILNDIQQKKARSVHQFRHSQVTGLMNFYFDRKNVQNPNFAYIRQNDEFEMPCDDDNVPSGLITIRQGSKKKMNEEMSSVARDDMAFSNGDNSGHEVHANCVLIDDEPSLGEERYEAAAKYHSVYTPLERGSFSRDSCGKTLSQMFPELFPFGCGHPDSERRVRVSFHACIKRYLLCASKRFAQHPTFAMASFDQISKMKAFVNTSIQIKCKSASDIEAINAVQSKDLENFLQMDQIRSKFYRCGRGQEVEEYDRKTGPSLMMSSIAASKKKMWGTNESRILERNKAFGMMTYFGNCHAFMTITPDSTSNYTIMMYAGQYPNQSLEDADVTKLPTPIGMYSISSKNPVAHAKFFEKIMQVFLSTGLGFDAKHQRPYRRGGWFGWVKAYAASIESQGTGNLHMHMLLWLVGMPPTVEQLQERLDDVLNGTHFKQNLAIFADAIVSHSMPLELSRLSCPNCNLSNPNSRNGIFEGLPIPSETRSRQHKDQEGPIKIISCTVCQMKFSSLELNIALLKQERPIQFDENEFNLAEIPCPGCSKLDRTKLMGVFSIYNDTQVETKYRKTGRKSPLYRCHFCSERFDTATLRMVSLKQQIPGQVFSPFMTQSQSTSASCDCIEDTATENGRFQFECKKETEKMYQQKLREDCDCRDICLTFLHDDPFLKEILCLPQPPCLRHISKEAADYIMAAILMRYNTHSWSHRGSCFKASARTRAINTEFIKVCRYLYPREPIDGTQYSGVKMQLQRTIGSEYLNAYNYFTTMAFRCNCDIQILLQSYGACEIIYYVYKYGFKNQQRIDSAAVLAVNSLRKRITRENQDEKVGDMVTEDTKAKRRINALSIGITNRQEIADTICSSIILYGTLSKFSHDFDNLHLGQYMKILESEPFTAMLEKVTKMDSKGDKNVTFHPSSDFTYYTERGEELDYINTFLFCSNGRK